MCKFLLSTFSPFRWFITGVKVSSFFCFSYIWASIFSKFFFFLSKVFFTFSSICSLVILFVTFFPIFSSNKILATSLFSFSNWSLTTLAAILISLINSGFPSSCSIWKPFLPKVLFLFPISDFPTRDSTCSNLALFLFFITFSILTSDFLTKLSFINKSIIPSLSPKSIFINFLTFGSVTPFSSSSFSSWFSWSSSCSSPLSCCSSSWLSGFFCFWFSWISPNPCSSFSIFFSFFSSPEAFSSPFSDSLLSISFSFLSEGSFCAFDSSSSSKSIIVLLSLSV